MQQSCKCDKFQEPSKELRGIEARAAENEMKKSTGGISQQIFSEVEGNEEWRKGRQSDGSIRSKSLHA